MCRLPQILILFVMVTALPGGGVWAADDLDLSLLAGASMPLGDFGDAREAGPRAGGAIDYQITNSLSLGLEALWGRNDLRSAYAYADSNGLSGPARSVNGLEFGFRARVFLPITTGSRRVYLHGGVGVYDLSRGSANRVVTISFLSPDSLYDSLQVIRAGPSSGFDFGGKLGTGVDFRISQRMRLGLEAELNMVSGSQTFVGVHGAVVVILRPKERSLTP